MEKNATKFDLIRSLYNETTTSENRILAQDLANNADLKAEYTMLREAKDALPKVQFDPSESVLNRIMAFSRQTAAQTVWFYPPQYLIDYQRFVVKNKQGKSFDSPFIGKKTKKRHWVFSMPLFYVARTKVRE